MRTYQFDQNNSYFKTEKVSDYHSPAILGIGALLQAHETCKEYLLAFLEVFAVVREPIFFSVFV